MEESIRNAERLIKAANSVLAQMKFDVSYDEFSFAASGKIGQRMGILEDEQNRTPAGSIAGAKEKIPNVDEIFALESLSGLSKSSSSPVNNDVKIEEINNKIEVYKKQLLEREERRSWKALQSGVKELAASRSPENVLRPRRITSDTDLPQTMRRTASGTVNIAEDLNSKLVQTEEIVSRGIQTARELSETVDSLKSRHVKSDEASSMVPPSKSRTSENEKPIEKSDSRSSVKSVEVKRCRRCYAEMVPRREGKSKAPKSAENIAVVSIRDRDCSQSKCGGKQLRKQRLPNLSIRGDLSWQKIPSINIFPDKPKCQSSNRANAAFETYSHEQILRDRMERVVEEEKKSNGSLRREKCGGRRNVECSNCGKVIVVGSGIADAEKIDELLETCNYNVFDPRIDEFVERRSIKLYDEAKFTQTEEVTPGQSGFSADPADEVRQVGMVSREIAANPAKVEESVKAISHEEKRVRISELSRELTRKYKEKAAELENDHLNFESILRDLFKTVDESRKIFQDCEFLSSVVEERSPKRKSNLTSTMPVLVSFSGSGCEEVDDGTNAVIHPSKQSNKRNKMSAKEIKIKLEKRELRTNRRILSSSDAMKEKAVNRLPGIEEGGRRKAETGSGAPTRHVSRFRRVISPPTNTSSDTEESSGHVAEKTRKEIANRKKLRMEGEKIPSPLSRAEQTCLSAVAPSSGISPVNSERGDEECDKDESEQSAKNQTAGSDYESDFEESNEEETPEVVGASSDPNPGDRSYSFNVRLSTISEVDSEVDRLSDNLQSSVEEEKREINGGTPPQSEYLPIPASERDKVEQTPGRDAVVSPTRTLSSDDDTRKLLKRVNRELQEVISLQLLSPERDKVQRNFPQEMTEPLKEVLNALKNQFERTEQLADKLTESLKEKEARASEREREILVTPNGTDPKTTDQLQKTRKHAETDVTGVLSRHGVCGFELLRTLCGPEPEGAESSRELLERIKMSRTGRLESVASLAEPVRKGGGLASSSGSFQTSAPEEKSYSEGEISERELLRTGSSSPSIGEIIDEIDLDGSATEGNSVITFA